MAAQKEKIEELTRRLAMKLSARERSIKDKKHTAIAVVVRKRLTEHVR